MIVGDCLQAVAPLKEIECAALCVRPQSENKGKELCERYQIPTLYTDYGKLLAEENLDVIYIGIVNTEHYSYAKKALEAGKNVILEKPFTIRLEEAKELAGLAKQKELYLFEAITTIYFPNFRFVKEQLDSLGDVKLVQCNFSQYSSRYDRYLLGDVAPAFDPALGGGALYDLNIYNIHFVVRLFGKPKTVRYQANKGHNGVDTSGILFMEYEDFQVECVAAKDSSGPNFGIVQGTKGYIRVNGQTSICESVDLFTKGELSNANKNTCSHRMQHEFLEFERIYSSKNLQECYENLEHSLAVMEVLISC